MLELFHMTKYKTSEIELHQKYFVIAATDIYIQLYIKSIKGKSYTLFCIKIVYFFLLLINYTYKHCDHLRNTIIAVVKMTKDYYEQKPSIMTTNIIRVVYITTLISTLIFRLL